MTYPRRRLTALLLASSAALAGACSSVTVVETSGGTTSGSGGAAGPGSAAGGAASGGAASGGAAPGGGGSGGAAPVDLPWQVTAADDHPGVQAVAADGAGNVVVTGRFAGSLDLGGEPLVGAPEGSLFVAKLDAGGHLLWARSFDNANALGLALDTSGDVLLAGDYRDTIDFGGGPLTSLGSADVFVARLDPQGNHLYSRSFGGPHGQLGGGIAVDAAGNAYVTGAFNDVLDFGGGPLPQADVESAFVVKLDASGEHVWSRSFSGDENVAGKLIAVAADGTVAITGSYTGNLDLGEGPLPPGGTAPKPSTFLLELDASGNPVFSRGFNAFSAAPVFDDAGNLFVSGPFTGSVDFGAGPMWSGYFVHLAVAKFDPAHALLWAEQFGDVTTTVYGSSAFPGGDGSLLLAGYATGKLDLGGGEILGGPGFNGFVARLDGAGQHLWSRGFGGPGDVEGTSAAVGPTGDVFYAGTFDGTVDLVTGPATGQGMTSDFFVLEIVP
jgi:hypothetical protein